VRMRTVWIAAAPWLSATACGTAPQPAGQNPSPMVEHTREHRRLDTLPPAGDRFAIAGLLPRPIVVYVPPRAAGAPSPALVVHFNGAAYVGMHAAAAQDEAVILAAIHLGAGSGIYQEAFRDAAMLARIRQAVADSLAARSGAPVRFGRMVLSGFSAGYGAIRAVLENADAAAAVDGVLLLDGLHVSYIPERTPLASGGTLDTARLDAFVRFARQAAAGERAMLVTHSEIFPGTFASTTETADYLLRRLALRRTPVLEWGPVGMQLLSTAGAGRLAVLGFAGNTAPDHVDHYHGMPEFLARLLALAGGP
jgi:hypothetical protein